MYKVLGFKTGVFTDKTTHEVISYSKLYVSFSDKNVTGEACEALSVKRELLNGLKVGDKVEIRYNRYGKPVGVELV